jgi:hypothetical protein
MANNIRVVIQKPVDGSGVGVTSINTRTGVVVPVNGDYTTAQVTESTDKKYVTDAEKVVVGNTSGTNTGDETTGTIQTKRPLKTLNTKSLEGTGNETLDGTEVELIDGGGVTVTGAIGDLDTSVTTLETNKVNSVILGEPTGSDVILNTVSLTQAEYDAGTPIATTLYVITD